MLRNLLQITLIFFEKLNLENKAALEFRDTSWWKEVKNVADIGIAFCSVDAWFSS